MALHGLARVESRGWTDKTVMVESSRKPFMAPLGHAPCKDLSGGGLTENKFHFVGLLQGERRSRVVHRKLERVAGVSMSGCSPLSMEDNRDDCNCSCCGGLSYGCSGKEAEESNMPLREDDGQGEQWFNKENSQAKRWSLFRLEQELDAMLWFEHGDGSGGGPKES